MTYYIVEKYIPEEVPASMTKAGWNHGYVPGWHLSGEYLDQGQAEDHGKDLVRRGFEARVKRIDPGAA